jgi:hypothetical protein
LFWQEDWKIPDDEKLKKRLLSQMAALHRKFRTDLTTKFALKGKTPKLNKYQISQADWDAFVVSRQSEAFRVCVFLYYIYRYFISKLLYKSNCFSSKTVGAK